MRKLLLIFLTAVLCPLSVQAVPCPGQSEPPVPPINPPGNVCGTLWRLGYNGFYYVSKPAGTSSVRICPAGQNSNCTTVGTYSYTDGYGVTQQAFNFAGFTSYLGDYGAYFDLYAWGTGSTDYWGTSSAPVRKNVWLGRYGDVGVNLNMPPRPLDPTPIYPSGSFVGNGYLVRWNSGRDIDRHHSQYVITYAVWFKYWPFGGTEPSSYSLARANMPCHDDGTNAPNANNECDTYVVGPQPAGNWKWYVVADLDASRNYWPGTITTTQSGERAFVQPNP